MQIQKILPFVFLILVSFNQVFSQEKALSLISKDDMKRHLTYISSDELQGRKLGTEVNGLEITANYLAGYAKDIGLKPAGDSYFQKVELIKSKPLENSYFEITGKKGKVLFKTGDLLNYGKSQGVVEVKNDKIVFLGFGSDGSGVQNIEGKVVLVSQGTTEQFLNKNNAWSGYTERAKIKSISEGNPELIVIVLNGGKNTEKTFGMLSRYLNREQYGLKTSGDNTPVLIAKPEVADVLLGRKGKYKKYLTLVAKKKKSAFYEIKSKKISSMFGAKTEPVEGKNIIGFVEGSDPVLKNEYFVYMAHYDHLGVAADGDVYNGADDNGSGTVTLMELAKAFSGLEKKPKRSIVFLWVTCEELGMLGSLYYSDHPLFPMDKTVACINIDMDGRVYEPRDSVWNKSPKKVKDFYGLYTLTNNVWPELIKVSDEKCAELSIIPDKSLPERFLHSSDHYSFHKNGVPVLNYATGYHADYHKPGDEVSKINFDKIKLVADLSFLVGYEIANLDKIEFKRIQNVK